MNIAEINAWVPAAAHDAFSRCCHSTRWAAAMVAARPFTSEADLLAQAVRFWWTLDPADWREAFAGHPRIGDREALRGKFPTTAAWAAGEQAGALSAPDSVLEDLAVKNREYETRFGYIFIVCATGKTAEEMLAMLNDRLQNEAVRELTIAAREQMRITEIRLGRITP